MNYIKEINAFYDQLEWNPLSASAVTLWHALMHINNKTRWMEEFTVAAKVLMLKSGLTESSFKRARTELKAKGYIDYKPSKNTNQAPTYKILSKLDLQTDHATNQDTNQQSNQYKNDYSSTLNKQNKTKQYDTYSNHNNWSQSRNYNNRYTEVVPDWFIEMKKKQREKKRMEESLR